jgi:hypothetical protein
MRYRFSPVFAVLPCILSLGSIVSAAPPVTPPAQDRASAARALTLAKVGAWQRQLDLQDWKVTLRFTPLNQFKPGIIGEVDWDRTAKTAVIRVLEPEGYRLSYEDMLKDMEFTVVHGLVHLEISSLPRNRRSMEQEDLAVSQLTDALLRLERGWN